MAHAGRGGGDGGPARARAGATGGSRRVAAAADRRRAAVVVRAGADAGAWRAAGRSLPRRDGRGGARSDGDPPSGGLPAGGSRVQPELATAAA